MFDPLVVNKVAMLRALTRFAKHIGMSELMASSTAQVFLQTDPGLPLWDQWLRKNCATCSQVPGDCSMINPPEDQVPGGLTPDQFTQGQIHVIETGRLKACPRKTSPP